MASGLVCRTNRPNTWLHRPACKREGKPCQLGAVHTWHSQLAAGLHDGKGGVEIVEQSEELSHDGCLTVHNRFSAADLVGDGTLPKHGRREHRPGYGYCGIGVRSVLSHHAVSAPCDSVEAAVSLVSGKRQLITVCVVPARGAFRRVPK